MTTGGNAAGMHVDPRTREGRSYNTIRQVETHTTSLHEDTHVPHDPAVD
jgi:hypothetical protein